MVSRQAFWLGGLAGCGGSVCMGDRVEQSGKFFIHLSSPWLRLTHRNGIPFVWDNFQSQLSESTGEMLWTAVRVQFGMAA